MFSSPAAVDILLDGTFSLWEMMLSLNPSIPGEGTQFVNIFAKNDQNNPDRTALEYCNLIRSKCIILAPSFRFLRYFKVI